MRRSIKFLATTLFVGILALVLMIAFGGPTPPSIHPGLSARSAQIVARAADQPAPEVYRARDGAALSYRHYPGTAGQGLVVLVHGSSGSNAAVHSLARSMSASGIAVFAPDMRGHGASGPHGDIAYAGQLDDDMADMARMLAQRFPDERRLLVGHSSGGGFVLHIAGNPRGCVFDGYLALSPYLNYASPTNRPDAGWAAAGVPRIIGLTLINRFGLTSFDNLPALAFALDPNAHNRTATYSWRLMRNFGLSMSRWEQEISAIDRPTRVIIGASDELFQAAMYPQTIARLQPRITVSILPGIDHMGMVLDGLPIAEVTKAAHEMLNASTTPNCPAG